MLKSFKFLCFTLIFLGLSAVAFAQTVYTGETYRGKEVISYLDVTDLAPGAVYEFFFEGTRNQLGHSWYIPVTVIKGNREGERFMISAGIHGNEVNVLLPTYRIKQMLTPENVVGTVTIVHAVNIPGLLANRRGFVPGGNQEYTNDLNRLMNQDRNRSAAEQYATLLWENLLSVNADMAIDIHTSGKGSELPLFVYADFRAPDVKRMAELAVVDVIKMDNGAAGTIETAFVESGIPAFTYELGAGERLQMDMVERSILGIVNNLIEFGYVQDDELFLSKWPGQTFTGNTLEMIYAERGGYVENFFELNDYIEEGETVFIQYDPLGNIVATYEAPVSGVLTWLNTDPYVTPGAGIGELIYYDPADPDQNLMDEVLDDEVLDDGSTDLNQPLSNGA